MVRRLLLKYRGILVYGFFGVCTTAINLLVYYVCAHLIGMSTAWSTVVAWLLAVLFAFLTNKSWVFGSKVWSREIVIREAISFYLCRLATGLFDLGVMLVTVDLLGWNDMWMKLLSNVLVIVLNYVASRLIIFKKGRELSAGKRESVERIQKTIDI